MLENEAEFGSVEAWLPLHVKYRDIPWQQQAVGSEQVRPWPSDYVETVPVPEVSFLGYSRSRILEVVDANVRAAHYVPVGSWIDQSIVWPGKVYCLDIDDFRRSLDQDLTGSVQKIVEWVDEIYHIYQRHSLSLVPCVVVMGSLFDLIQHSDDLVSAGAILFQKPDDLNRLSKEEKINFLINELRIGESDFQISQNKAEAANSEARAEAGSTSEPDLSIYAKYPIELGGNDFQSLVDRMRMSDSDTDKND